MIRPRAFVLLPTLYVTLFCILFAGCDESRDLFYSDLTGAAQAGELDRGWIPDYLPKTSRAIHLVESDFKGFSYGFRPGRSPHQALDALTVGIQSEWLRNSKAVP